MRASYSYSGEKPLAGNQFIGCANKPTQPIVRAGQKPALFFKLREYVHTSYIPSYGGLLVPYKRPILFCDIETSGLDVISAVPLELGFMLDRVDNDPKPAKFFQLTRPTDAQWQLASPQALAVNGITRERCDEEGLPLQEVGDKLCGWLVENLPDHFMYVGQNPKFDLRFIDHYFGPKLAFLGIDLGKPVDVIDMAKELAKLDKTVQFASYKGAAISEALGLAPENAVHTALGGVQTVKQNYYALAYRLNKLTKE